MRWLVALAMALGCVSAPPARHARPTSQTPSVASTISVFPSSQSPAMTEGETLLDTDPATAYAELADYLRWPQIFADIYTVTITKQDGDDARVTFLGPDDHRDNLHFHNRSAEHTIWFEDTGGSSTVWAEIAFLPGAPPSTTRVHSRLFAEVGGFGGLFVSDDRVRKLREQRVYDDLFDLRAHFAHH